MQTLYYYKRHTMQRSMTNKHGQQNGEVKPSGAAAITEAEG